MLYNWHDQVKNFKAAAMALLLTTKAFFISSTNSGIVSIQLEGAYNS